MVKPILSILLVLPALAASSQTAPPKSLPMQDAVTYSNAGIAVAVPKGFEFRIATSPFDVFSATVEEAGKAVKAITLAAFPIGEAVSAEEFAEGKMAELSRNVSIRNLKTARKQTMKIAGIDGAIRLVSYTFRGTDSVAAQVYFIRDIGGGGIRICYLLTVVTTAEKRDTLVPTLGAVTGSVSFSGVAEPQIPAAVTLDEQTVLDVALGFAIRVPKGWYVDRSGGGIETGLINYAKGGIPLPSVKVTAAAAPPDSTSQSASTKYLMMLKGAAVQNKQDTRTISDANAMLGELAAWQFSLQIMEKPNPIPSLSARKPDDVVLIHRTACQALPGRQQVAFTVTVTAKASEQAVAARLMEEMAKTFKALPPPTQPAPATRPATSPAGNPATQPAGPDK